ncbi:hypothetical protein BDW22DRAFT_432515 [Trametopsis cervina]|nr:hypothetical protein BDW22DRAFT_432515 [Trametopsis cervina]
MTIPDPPWKQKSEFSHYVFVQHTNKHLLARPCPFYSQGRCLFSDSCNFLHDVKIKVKQPPDITVTESTSDDLRSPKYASTVATEHQSPGSQVRSPPRSPRLSSLLLALGDVIESDEEGQNDASPIYSYDSLVPPLTSETHGTETTIPIKEPADQSLASEDSASATGGHIPDEAAPSVSYSSLTKRGSGDLLSPIEVKLGVGFLGQLEGTLHREDSIDSGYADGWTGPSPLSLSPPRPQNARRYSTLSLLSSPFGSPARALSPQFTPSAGSAWPTSPLFSPVRSKAGSRPSSLHLSQASNDDLDSPTDYYRRLSAGSPELPTAGLDQDATIRNTATVALHDDDREPPALPTVVAPKKTLDTPTHVLPVEEAVVASNEISPTGSTSPDGPPREDATVEVEVPPISPVFSSDDQTTDEDTTALYGSYYSEVLYTNSPRAAELPPSVRAPPISFIREADVQAAPQRSPSNASRRSSQAILPDARGTPEFVAGSSRDLYSPNRDVFAVSAPASRLGSPALSVRSPAIHSAGGSPSLSRQSSFSERVDQTRSPLKTTTTTKIPFGFRHTAAVRVIRWGYDKHFRVLTSSFLGPFP